MHKSIVPTVTLSTAVILMLSALLLLLPGSSLADVLVDNKEDTETPTIPEPTTPEPTTPEPTTPELTIPEDEQQLNNQLYLPLVTNGSLVQDESATTHSEMVMAAADASFPALDVRMIGDATKIGVGGVPGCSRAIHDLYFVIGPDGKKYRTWHALWHPKGVNGIPTIAQIIRGKDDPACYFAHEHGDIPLAIAKPATGAPLPPFGYAALRGMGMVEDHPGYKVFTHLRGQRTGWHQPTLGWFSNEPGTIAPDWDMEVVAHQGTPSLRSSVNAPGATRVSQRFHEIIFWMKDPQGRVTNVKVVGDTGSPIGSAGCSGELSEEGEPTRRIADGCRTFITPSMYENWQYQVKVADVWRAAPEVDVVNPMDYLIDMDEQKFKSASETLCGVEPNASGCAQKLPFGHPGTPALAYMGTQRNLHNPDWRWSNAGGAQFICTDASGNRVPTARCDSGDPAVILQQVAPINFNPGNDGSFNRTGASSMFRLAFPELTDIPNQPQACRLADCTWRMPQGAPLGN